MTKKSIYDLKRISLVPGRICVEWWVLCGVCIGDDPLDEPKKPAKQARDLGWKRRKGLGWVCPRCIAKVDVELG
jgi:hypothetical protein